MDSRCSPSAVREFESRLNIPGDTIQQRRYPKNKRSYFDMQGEGRPQWRLATLVVPYPGKHWRFPPISADLSTMNALLPSLFG